MDLFFFSLISVIVFGFVSVFLVGSLGQVANFLIMGVLLWEVIRITQYSITLGALWNIWSRNLSNMFIAPMSTTEYFIAQLLSGLIKALIVFVGASILTAFLFKFNILDLGLLNLVLLFTNLTIFAWSAGIIVLAAVFRYGTRIQALAWSVIFLFQPLSAAFFPLSVLPQPIQKVALAFPATYVFEAARFSLVENKIHWQYMGISFLENLVYFALSLLLFAYMFKKSKETGQFARNEG